MRKPESETRVTILAIFIVVAVIISGFLVYRSLKEIVSSIQSEASTDFRLIIIKDISLDLLEIENDIQLYALTKNKSNLEHYEKVNQRLKNRIVVLAGLSEGQTHNAYLNDSVKYLVEAKLEIWEEIKRINDRRIDPSPQFEELYSMLEKKEIDTVRVEVEIPPTPPKGFFRKIFEKKDTTVQTRIDTTIIERTVENEEIREQIEQLEAELRQSEQRRNRRELLLIEQNIQVTGQLNNLVAQIEKEERDNLIERNQEADRLATLIYKRLSAFSIMAVAMLFIVLYLFVRYLQKAKKYQQILTKAKHEAENLSKAKEVFIANVSHEMRTPVNAIYGLTEQLLQHKTSAKIKEKLVILLKSSQHLKAVVNDTLDFSKIRAKKLKFEEVDFAPENVISEILSLHKSEAADKNIDLFYQPANKLPEALAGDPFRLKQILINTIGNAIKFTEKGNVTLKVKSEKTEDDMFRLHFWIKDTGIGISKENLEHIFEDFVQAETDYTRKFSGTGLGLSIVKKLIELQSGEITINSELNKGTVVSFSIPYKSGNPENLKQLSKEKITVPGQVKELKILGIDDEEYNRYLLKVIFEKWEVEFKEAKNGKEAVKLALNNEFDIILMDLRMPELNGIEAAKQIMRKKPHSKIIAVAAINGESEIKMCREAGMSHFLAKPFSESNLLDTIVSVLRTNANGNNSKRDFKLEELERLTGGDHAFMKEMIQVFINSTENGIKDIKLALTEKNWKAISNAAHKMAAPCKHIMANDLYDKIKQLEKNTENSEELEKVTELVLFIEQKVEKINKSLSDLIESGRFDS
ncbi:MAG: ATP-binding protein [Bacteroidota bacterium]